jgi:hypothetical protein
VTSPIEHGKFNVIEGKEKFKTHDVSRTLEHLGISIPNLASLPPLEHIDIQSIMAHEEESLVPLRLCFGSTGEGKVWMYIKKGTNLPVCKIEITHAGQIMTDTVKLREEDDIQRNGITLSEPFLTGKAKGTYIRPMFDMGKYYFFLACKNRGLELQEHDIAKDVKFEQYLKQGVNAYHKKNAPAQSHPTASDELEDHRETAYTASDGSLPSPSILHQTGVSPALPSQDQQNPSYAHILPGGTQ